VLLNEIVERTDGVPLFVEELTGELDRLEIPSSLHDSLMARLDRLEPLKEVAQIAACIGREFERSLLSQVSPLSLDELNEALDGLIRAELVFRRGAGASYVFKHALVRDAAYESLLNTRRRAVHADILSALEKDAESPPEILAHHATQAGKTRLGINLWKQAGAHALSRPAYQEAIGHFRNAVRLTAEIDDRDWAHERELELQIQIRQACIAHKGWGGNDTDRAFERALELVDLLDDTPLRLPAIYGKWVVQYVRGEESRSLVQRFQTSTASAEDSGVKLVAWRMRLLQHLRDGEFPLALELAKKSVNQYDPKLHRSQANNYSHDARAAALVYGSWALWHLGFPDQARASRDEALKWAEELEHASTTGLARCFGGAFLGALERNVEQVAEHAYKSVELAKTLEMPLWLGWSRVFLGWALALRGDLDTGSSEIEQGILELRNNRCVMLMPILLGLSAEANAAAGKLELAHGDIDDGFDVLEKSHYVAWKSHLHLVRGELHLLGSVPDLEQAQKQFATAVDLARAQQIRMIELRAATRLASVRAVTGNADKAVETLSALYGSFTEGFDTPDLKSTKKLLDQLS
jgi:predicted ATPase